MDNKKEKLLKLNNDREQGEELQEIIGINQIQKNEEQNKEKNNKYSNKSKRKIFLLSILLIISFIIVICIFIFLKNKKKVFKTLVIFDFDKTLSVFDTFDSQLILFPNEEERNEIRKRVFYEDWSELITSTYARLKEIYITINDIHKLLATLPLNEGMKELLSFLKTKKDKYYLIVLSGGHLYQVEYILKEKKVYDIFDGVISNPSIIENGTIVVHKKYEHNCDFCNPSQCKTKEFNIFIEKKKKDGLFFDKVIFICDGRNDFCLARNLGSNDLVLAKKGMDFEKYLNSNEKKEELKAKVDFWENAFNLIQFFNTSF